MNHKFTRVIDKFISRFRVPLRIITLIYMIAAFLFNIHFFITYKAYEYVDVTANFTIYSISVIFLAILYIFSYTGKNNDILSTRYVEVIIFLLYISMSAANTTVVLDGYPDKRSVIIFLNVLSYAAAGMFYPIFWAYQYEMNKPKRWGKQLTTAYMTLSVLYIILSLINPMTGWQYTVSPEGYTVFTYNDMISSIVIFALSVLFTLYTVNIGSGFKKMFSMLSYFMFPDILVIINFIAYKEHSNINLPSLAALVSVLAIYLVFFNVHTDQKNELIQRRAEYTEMRSALMLSQIQPHFIYNSLATISALCDFDPKLAKETTNKFSDYLRANIEAMSETALVPFEREIFHVETYTDLEKTRFGDKLIIEYDIKAKNFLIPSLTLQPIVENSVKHGVCKKRGGGKVRISSYETADCFCITVEDTGVGFDTEKDYNTDGKNHVGIANVKSRLQSLVSGTLTVQSIYGEGTSVKIEIPKRREQVTL